MRVLFLITLIGSLLLGCTHHWFEEPYPEILDAEKQQVSGCKMVGVISETADAANPWSIAATQNMILLVRERAGQLGGTHLVWLHQTANMATAEVYRCP